MSPEQLPSKIGKSVGEKLRAARIAQNYTQSQLATPDFSVSYISAIERGQIHPSLRALEILANRLGLSSTQLLPQRSQQGDKQSPSSAVLEHEEDEGEMNLLEIHILITQNNAEQALARLNKISTKRLKRQQQVQYRYLLAWAHFQADHLQESQYLLSDLAQSLKDTNNTYILHHVLNLLGQSYAAERNFAQAVITHQSCLHKAEETGLRDPFFIIQVYMCLSQYHMHLNNIEEALHMCNNAIAIINEFDTPLKIQAAYSKLCQHYVETKDFFVATIYTYKAMAIAEQARQKQLKSDLYYYLGQALIKGDQDQAFAALNTICKQPGQTSLVVASATARIAEWHLAHNHLQEAEQCAQSAYEAAQSFGDTTIAADTLLVWGRVNYAQNKYTPGDEHFKQGLTMLERRQRHEELTEQYVQYAQLLEKRGEEHEAFTYFRRAFQSS